MVLIDSMKWASFFLQVQIEKLSNKLEREPTLQELQQHYKDLVKSGPTLNIAQGFFFMPFMADPKTTLDIVQKKIKNGPTSCRAAKIIRYDELKRYLKVYDLIKSGKKMKEVIEIISPEQRGDNANVLRAFRRDLTKAKSIIINAEHNVFPGTY